MPIEISKEPFIRLPDSFANSAIVVQQVSEDELRIVKLEEGAGANRELWDIIRQTGGVLLTREKGKWQLGELRRYSPREDASEPTGRTRKVIVGPSQVIDGEVPEEVATFCAKHGLSDAVKSAFAAVRESFPESERIDVSVVKDEFGDEVVTFNVVVRDEPEVENTKYFECLGKWVAAIPPQAADKIRLSTSWE